jgi:restriction endonuclease S subunit
MLNSNINILQNGFTGSTINHISKEYFKNIEIPIPKCQELIQELEPLFQQIEILHNEIKNAENLYNSLIQELSEEALPTIKTANNNENTQPITIEIEIKKEEMETEKIIETKPEKKKRTSRKKTLTSLTESEK